MAAKEKQREPGNKAPPVKFPCIQRVTIATSREITGIRMPSTAILRKYREYFDESDGLKTYSKRSRQKVRRLVLSELPACKKCV